jgi:uncharacterized DUF497 family protein
VEIEFDISKAASNKRKHGVSFDEAATALLDPNALSAEDKYAADEHRWILLGTSCRARMLVVVYTLRENRIRIISARKATKREIDDYAKTV